MWRRFCSVLSKELSDTYVEKRTRFFQLEKVRRGVLDLDRLSEKELEIHRAHEEAVNNLHFSYIDPSSGEKVFTRYYRYLAGVCCGQACRHCTYNFERVPEPLLKNKIFNSSFWVDTPLSIEQEKKKINKIFSLIRVKPIQRIPSK